MMLEWVKWGLGALLYHVGLHSLAVLGSPLIDVLSSRIGAHKANSFNGWMVTDEVHSYTKIKNGYLKSFFFICAAPLRLNMRALRPQIQRFKSSCLQHCWITYIYGLHILWKFPIDISPMGFWLVLESSLDLFPLRLTRIYFMHLNECRETHTHLRAGHGWCWAYHLAPRHPGAFWPEAWCILGPFQRASSGRCCHIPCRWGTSTEGSWQGS